MVFINFSPTFKFILLAGIVTVLLSGMLVLQFATYSAVTTRPVDVAVPGVRPTPAPTEEPTPEATVSATEASASTGKRTVRPTATVVPTPTPED